IEPARREAQAAECYEGVAPPVGEPWISGDDGPPFATAHEVGIRGAVETRGKGVAPPSLRCAQPGDRRLRGGTLRKRRPALQVRRENEDRLLAPEIEAENARRGQVLDVIEPASPLLRVENVSIPERLVMVAAVRKDSDARDSGVGVPGDPLARDHRVEAEGGVLVMQS